MVLLLIGTSALATPTTQIVIPATDIQKFGTVHIHLDGYVRVGDEPDGTRKPPILVLGPTVGILPWSFLQAEVGFDVILQGDGTYDREPFYFHGKLAVPEDAMFKWSPALAVGGYNIGTRWTGASRTDQNIVYGLIARTVPYLGRLTFGYYGARKDIFVDENGHCANHGFLASWDRTISELTDKLWVAIDFQSGHSALGSLNVGVAYQITPAFGVLVGFDHYLYPAVGGRDTVTLQLDIVPGAR